MATKSLNAKDKIFLTVTTLSWVMLFASIGKRFVEPSGLGEIVGICCGISVSFVNVYVYRRLKASADN